MNAVTEFNLLGIILAILVAYLLGSLPIAAWVSRRRGVDIFNVGTGLPGASNVRRSVGNIPGGMVLIGDLAKGLIAIVVARQMQVEGLWLILPCFSMIAGHWKSIFTGFRGGDGLAPLGGAIIVMFPPFSGFLAVFIGSVVTLGGQKLPYTSLLGLVAGIASLIWLVRINAPEDIALAAAVGVVAAMVLVHASVGHKRRNTRDEWSEFDEGEGATE